MNRQLTVKEIKIDLKQKKMYLYEILNCIKLYLTTLKAYFFSHWISKYSKFLKYTMFSRNVK